MQAKSILGVQGSFHKEKLENFGRDASGEDDNNNDQNNLEAQKMTKKVTILPQTIIKEQNIEIQKNKTFNTLNQVKKYNANMDCNFHENFVDMNKIYNEIKRKQTAQNYLRGLSKKLEENSITMF